MWIPSVAYTRFRFWVAKYGPLECFLDMIHSCKWTALMLNLMIKSFILGYDYCFFYSPVLRFPVCPIPVRQFPVLQIQLSRLRSLSIFVFTAYILLSRSSDYRCTGDLWIEKIVGRRTSAPESARIQFFVFLAPVFQLIESLLLEQWHLERVRRTCQTPKYRSTSTTVVGGQVFGRGLQSHLLELFVVPASRGSLESSELPPPHHSWWCLSGSYLPVFTGNKLYCKSLIMIYYWHSEQCVSSRNSHCDCSKICETVPYSMHAWTSAVTAMAWAPVIACSRLR